ncbi:MAG: UbiH/UbiF/VisC/COQ6 family ubiquinone biosynthesis hydroxylase [Amylibacter sp.]|nr:UbiH/UbiF/VisC/COQ6 family ubiquinone biosynthesis hydroxylase [Amylibacter sp.]
MKYDTDIIIVGGGLNGCAAALALAQIGQDVILIDAQPKEILVDPAFDGRGYALALTTKNMLNVLGVWADVAGNSCPMLDIKVSDGRAGVGASPFFVHFDHTELEEGPMGYMLEDRFLRQALLRAIGESPAIRHLDQTTVMDQTIDVAGVSVELADGKTLSSKLLIGCDGRKSQVAARAGIKRSGHDYNQTSLVCAIKHALPHNNTAHQFFMPSGPLAILPLNDNTSSIVWTETTERAAEISVMNDADYMTCLRPCFGDFLGDISLKGGRFSYPLNLTLADRFVDHRLALVGDAAHGVHPLAGQGLNLGLRDIAALTEVLANAARRGEDIGTVNVLQRFQQWRRFDTAASVTSTDTINKLFSNDNSLLRTVRDLGLGLVNATPSLRRSLMRQAAGLTGDLPKMLQGKMV